MVSAISGRTKKRDVILIMLSSSLFDCFPCCSEASGQVFRQNVVVCFRLETFAADMRCPVALSSAEAVGVAKLGDDRQDEKEGEEGPDDLEGEHGRLLSLDPNSATMFQRDVAESF